MKGSAFLLRLGDAPDNRPGATVRKNFEWAPFLRRIKVEQYVICPVTT